MKRNKKLLSLIMMVIMLSALTCVSAFTAEEQKVLDTKYDFYPSQFIFEYNGYNSTDYEGDTGLKGAYVNNTVDNMTYYVPVEYVRTFAWMTKKSFKLDENIDVKHSLIVDGRAYDCILIGMFSKDGTEIPKLDIKSNSLTKEQRSYFDDYDQTREEYYQEQYQDTLEDIEDNSRRSTSYKDNDRGHYGFYYGTNGRGIMYTR
ncbi:MAG: hypothetical protein BZ137_01505 [Methanosphaera sp. rholeuAM130]|nr:MAG: hypothetical protein BZ137_01505 [Methanosphaera sp. rholeuAM130]